MSMVANVDEKLHEVVQDPDSTRRLAGRVLLLALSGLIPWIVYLAVALPVHHHSTHWDLVWVGFDCVLAFAFSLTLLALWRRSQYLPLSATALGTLLLADAWFDVTTAKVGGELLESALWLLLELPLAAFAFALAVWGTRDPHETRRAIDGLTRRERSGTLGRGRIDQD